MNHMKYYKEPRFEAIESDSEDNDEAWVEMTYKEEND